MGHGPPPAQGQAGRRHGADQGKELEISKPRVTGGRSIISDLVVQDKAVSGTHFEVARARRRLPPPRSQLAQRHLRRRPAHPRGLPAAGHDVPHRPHQDPVPDDCRTSSRSSCRRRIASTRCSARSPAMREIFAHLEKVAPSELTCLITGETGTGKEMVARALHNASARARASRSSCSTAARSRAS